MAFMCIFNLLDWYLGVYLIALIAVHAGLSYTLVR